MYLTYLYSLSYKHTIVLFQNFGIDFKQSVVLQKINEVPKLIFICTKHKEFIL